MKISQLINETNVSPMQSQIPPLPTIIYVDAAAYNPGQPQLLHMPMALVQSYTHLSTMQNKLKVRHNCPECPKTFSRHSDVKRHQRTIHAEINVQCQHCSEIFNRRDEYKKHCRRFHLS
jgi:uncharacterized Zn-finger protein